MVVEWLYGLSLICSFFYSFYLFFTFFFYVSSNALCLVAEKESEMKVSFS